ncbi:serine hydrolase domain-containing protein [Zunongwangia pacifica]|uniref:Beta-lactamase family protein n=1 Tax=Zunongwangia pacifica TaxID=2911062 RepID=A0A9X1ZZN2_9FLAO|nr:serine hydrolase domain-containing protein [Zunongwangia pacifica]MCL6219965.1 beta-lactamase family protein [Zunongwangia pacifica]
MKFIYTILIFLGSFTITAQENKSKVIDTIQNKLKELKIPGLQVAIIHNNEIEVLESFGYANVPFSIKTNDSTMFSINSIAKIFASTAIMQLVEKDQISIDQPIENYLDSLPQKWNSITIRQLLSHTSGLPEIEDSETEGLIGGKGQDSAWIAVQNLPLLSQPGEKFNYNATNYLLIQKIIEKYGKLPYEEFLQKNQFDIVGMNNTHFGHSFEVKENQSPTYCYYYLDKSIGDYVKGNTLLEVSETFPTMLRADAGAFSTASDLAKWIIGLQSGAFLKKNNVRQMWSPVKLKNGTFGGFGGMLNAYALGWPVIKRKEHTAVAPIGGGRASLNIYPDDQLSIILLTNLSGIPTYEIVDDIAKLYFEK